MDVDWRVVVYYYLQDLLLEPGVEVGVEEHLTVQTNHP